MWDGLLYKQLKLDTPSIFLTLQKDYGGEGDIGAQGYGKTFAVQRCGGEPYEIALRFAGCCLQCGPCFASGYAWMSKFQKNPRVISLNNPTRCINDYVSIPYPSGYPHYNWLRILGGEPLLNETYISFLFSILNEISRIDSKKFNKGIIIQTNGIFIGQGKTSALRKGLEELYESNPEVKVCIEVSIKGTNEEEFELITRSYNRPKWEFNEFSQIFGWDLRVFSPTELFKINLKAFYNLLDITKDLPNFKPTAIAGFGVNETYLLKGEQSKDRITIIFKNKRPIYHPDFWSNEFRELYKDFINYSVRTFGNLFSKMPMYGIKDDVKTYPFARRALQQGRQIYQERWYDAKYAHERGGRNMELERSFRDILNYFFYIDNRTYYSALINW
jgi:uncharacterized Fe-S cluster-containing radical SAM superfamily protein